eukprot:2920065-Alexandrium_andersonii.AAC.1
MFGPLQVRPSRFPQRAARPGPLRRRLEGAGRGPAMRGRASEGKGNQGTVCFAPGAAPRRGGRQG